MLFPPAPSAPKCAASSLRETLGSPQTPSGQEEEAARLDAVRAALGERAFADAWEADRAMTVEQAVAYALTGEDGLEHG